MAQIKHTTALPIGRIAIGAGAWAAPNIAGAVFGFNMAENPEAVYMGRLFGARDVLLGVGTLASTGPAKTLWWRLGIACDAADAAAGYLGFKSGGPKRGMILATVTALGAVAAGVLGSSELKA